MNETLATKDKSQFRDYQNACDKVKLFYKEQHGEIPVTTKTHVVKHLCTEKQTVEFNQRARVEYHSRVRARMGIWEAMEMLDTLVDDSDPDVSRTHRKRPYLTQMALDKPHTDSTPVANGRGHAPRWKARLDAGCGLDT
jgi:hypothetical protein